jgi:hypothetical protein
VFVAVRVVGKELYYCDRICPEERAAVFDFGGCERSP